MKMKQSDFLDLIREEMEQFLILKEKVKTPSVQAQVASGASESMSIPFPTVKITEDWGKPDSEDRQVLELLMKNVQGETVEAKLASVQEFLEYQPGRKINEIFSNLLFTEIFSNIMDEYNASTAGFLFEAFLAGLFGGERSLQIADKDEETGNLPIVDVELKGVPYSLKVLSPATPVKGSFFNMVNHFDNNDRVIYLVVEKKGEGILGFYEFELNPETFLNYIGYAGTRTKKNIERKKAWGNEIQTLEDGTLMYTPRGTEEEYPITTKSGKPARDKKLVGKQLPGNRKYDIYIMGTPTRIVNQNTIDLYGSGEEYDRLREITDKKELMDELKKQPGYKKNKQFKISSEYVRNTAKEVGELDLGKQKLKAVAGQYANDLQDSLIPIYRALQELTMNTNRYFLSDEGETGRKQHAMQASGNAGTLKSETDKLVK